MSRRGDAILWPNLGEEEGAEAAALASRARLASPAVRATAFAWRLAFPSAVRLRGFESLPGPWGTHEHAAWPWLDRWLDDGGDGGDGCDGGSGGSGGDNEGGGDGGVGRVGSEGGVGIPWLATRRVVDEMHREGARPVAADPAVVEALVDKAWAHGQATALGLVPEALEGLVTTWSAEELLASDAAEGIAARVASMPAWTAGRATLKPRWGTSGRGRVALVAGGAPPSAAALERLARRGGALLEPWLPRAAGLSTQWWLAEADDVPRVTWLGSVAQLASAAGMPRGSVGVVGEDGSVGAGLNGTDAELEGDAVAGGRALAEAAWRAGLRGPCGVDALAFDGPTAAATDGVSGVGGLSGVSGVSGVSGGRREGEPPRRVLRPILELNPRFTAGFVAIALARRAGLGEGAPGWFRHVLLASSGQGRAGESMDDGRAGKSELVELPGGGRLEIARAGTMRR